MTTFVLAAWGAFWLYWLIAAATAKSGSRNQRSRPAVGLIIVVFLEERLMTSSFPSAYRSYMAHTKMLIPFAL
ncbi:MAG TPA: hypothetical protein VGF81_08675 [Solirubrobacteraceae bacterium]